MKELVTKRGRQVSISQQAAQLVRVRSDLSHRWMDGRSSGTRRQRKEGRGHLSGTSDPLSPPLQLPQQYVAVFEPLHVSKCLIMQTKWGNDQTIDLYTPPSAKDFKQQKRYWMSVSSRVLNLGAQGLLVGVEDHSNLPFYCANFLPD